ncbi:MAG: hypothetical protein HC893_09085, partial [Chloroflexaceae bacterium]|nr:hypothetical protein [Chloroflexaceae bacterium]
AWELADHDRYSAATASARTALAIPPPDEQDTHSYLHTRAADLVQRLSYLEEPLAVWELDSREGLAQLRSCPPQQEGDDIFFWEVTLRTSDDTDAVHLTRYHWAPGLAGAEKLIYPATFTLVGRLIDTLSAAE